MPTIFTPVGRSGTNTTSCFAKCAPQQLAGNQNNQTPTNRTAGAPGATASSACPALRLAADVVFFHANQTVAANHLCCVTKGSNEFETTQIRRHITRPLKARSRAKSTSTPTLSNFGSSTWHSTTHNINRVLCGDKKVYMKHTWDHKVTDLGPQLKMSVCYSLRLAITVRSIVAWANQRFRSLQGRKRSHQNVWKTSWNHVIQIY